MRERPDPADHLELLDLVSRLSRGVDRADRDLVVGCYTKDSVDEHGAFRGTGAEFADYICGGSPISTAARSLHHCLGQSTFWTEGDEAGGETYYLMSLVTSEGGLVQGIGRYVDRFRRVDGRWLVAHRRVVTEWSGVVAVTESMAVTREAFAAARRDRDDPSYAVL